jgi:hypothetical protein
MFYSILLPLDDNPAAKERWALVHLERQKRR